MSKTAQSEAGQNLISKLLACAGARDRIVAVQRRNTTNLTLLTLEVVTEMQALDRCEVDAAKAAEVWLAVFYARYPERKP